jgi:hypothetical protein
MLMQNVSSDLLSGPVLELEHSGEKCRFPACPAVPGQKVRSETGPLKGTQVHGSRRHPSTLTVSSTGLCRPHMLVECVVVMIG